MRFPRIPQRRPTLPCKSQGGQAGVPLSMGQCAFAHSSLAEGMACSRSFYTLTFALQPLPPSTSILFHPGVPVMHNVIRIVSEGLAWPGLI